MQDVDLSPTGIQSSAVPVRSWFSGVLVFSPVLVYLGYVFSYIARVKHLTGGHFVYALDDPYIHLALAQQIAQGHYGINPGEAASPSSSIVWPLLLTPFAQKSWFVLSPLLLNMVAGVLLAAFLGYLVARFPGRTDSLGERSQRLLTVILLLFVGNVIGLTFLGMEHTLQVLLAALGAYCVILTLRRQDIPGFLLCLLALSPLVRYEAFAVVLAVALALIGRRKYRGAIALIAGSLLGPLLFSIYLHHLRLPLLPISVLVKGNATGHSNAFRRLYSLFAAAVKNAFQKERLLVLLLLFTLLELAWRQQENGRRIAFLGAALAVFAHFVLGQFNWLHRYEVYIVLFSTLIILYALFEQPRFLRGWYLLGLVACAGTYFDATSALPYAMEDIYLQQFQMHRFSTDFYKGTVAVNDLGLVSFNRPEHQYILDLGGLGSPEVALEQNKNPSWLTSIMAKHDVGLAMVYTGWFQQLPAQWTQLGTFCSTHHPVTLSSPCVGMYATKKEDVATLTREFSDWAATLPADDIVFTPGEGSSKLERFALR